MHKLPGLKNYFRIVKNIVETTIIQNKKVLIISICAISLNILAEYFVVKSARSSNVLRESFKTDAFGNALKTVLFYTLIAATLKFIPSITFTYFLQNIQREKFVHYLKEILDLNFEDFHSKTPGELQYAVFIKSYAAPMCCQLLVIEVSSVIGNVIFSFASTTETIDFKVASIFIFVPIIYLTAVLIYIKNKIKYHYSLLKSQQSTATKLSDKLLNYEAIKTYNLEEREAEDFYNVIGEQTKTSIKMGKYEAFSRYLLTFAINGPFVIAMIISSMKPSYFKSNLLTVVILYFSQASDLKRLGNNIDSLVEYLNQIDFTSVEHQITVNNELLNDDSLIDNCVLKNYIEFDNFSVLHRDKLIIENICEKIYKKEKIAVVGKNGTGKSSFIKSIMGFTSSKGEINVDGVSRKMYHERALLDLISYVPQEDFTSDDTVMNNILLGVANEQEKSEEEIMILRRKAVELSKKFGAHETFINLENGYDTKVGPRGNKLSGGQKQKISLIRAAMKDAPIFVLDEATASMDKKYERELIDIIFDKLKDKTIVMIVHGLEYLPMFDRIFFLNDKKLEQAGSFEELKKTNANFRNFIK